MDGVSNTYAETVKLFNKEQNDLWKARAWASLTALFLESGVATVFKMGLHSHIRLGSVVSMIALPLVVYQYFRVEKSKIIPYEESKISGEREIPLSAGDRKTKDLKEELGITRLHRSILSIILVVGTLFVFRARESIKLTAIGLSSLVFAISYVKFHYIHLDLDNLSVPIPAPLRPSNSLDGDGVPPVARKLDFSGAEPTEPEGQQNATKRGPNQDLDQSMYYDTIESTQQEAI